MTEAMPTRVHTGDPGDEHQDSRYWRDPREIWDIVNRDISKALGDASLDYASVLTTCVRDLKKMGATHTKILQTLNLAVLIDDVERLLTEIKPPVAPSDSVALATRNRRLAEIREALIYAKAFRRAMERALDAFDEVSP